MKETERHTIHSLTAIGLAFLSVVLIIVSFFLPPKGVIDPSVIKAVGEIIGVIGIFFAWDAILKGLEARITHGDTTIEIHRDEDEEKK